MFYTFRQEEPAIQNDEVDVFTIIEEENFIKAEDKFKDLLLKVRSDQGFSSIDVNRPEPAMGGMKIRSWFETGVPKNWLDDLGYPIRCHIHYLNGKHEIYIHTPD